ncbi:MAG: hypothetical protein RMJ84_06145 [Sandaracinaceae bacterium]|nr:hypothetical protein [Sandaracinaceae bacterium]
MVLPFSPTSYFRAQLKEGKMLTRGERRVLVVSEESMRSLVRLAIKSGDLNAIRRLGRAIGQEVLASLGEDPNQLPPHALVDHFAGLWALFGWGLIEIESWGDALVMRVEGSPSLDENQLGLAALLGGSVSALASLEVAAVPVGSNRFLLLAPEVADTVLEWSKKGYSLPAILDRLAPAPFPKSKEDA